jgi:hypothetical protein
MRRSLKGVLVLFIFTVVLAPIPVLQSTAWAEKFVNKAPHFTLEVPADWTVSKGSHPDPNSVLREAQDFLEITTFDVLVEDLPAGRTFKDLAKIFDDTVKKTYSAMGSEILYEREIKLKDGTPAYELEVKWAHPSLWLWTYEVVVFKGNKQISVTVTTNDKVNDNLKKIPLSLSFK